MYVTEYMSMHRLSKDQTHIHSVFTFDKQESGFEVSLVDGHIEMKDSTTNVKSKNRYDEGSWHYLTAFRNSTG